MADDRVGGRRSREPRDTTGRIPFIWVEDDSTGYRYDVPENAIRPGMTPVKGVDKNWTGSARPAKYRTTKAGTATTKTTTEKEGRP